jgi:hypothetical protein
VPGNGVYLDRLGCLRTDDIIHPRAVKDPRTHLIKKYRNLLESLDIDPNQVDVAKVEHALNWKSRYNAIPDKLVVYSAWDEEHKPYEFLQNCSCPDLLDHARFFSNVIKHAKLPNTSNTDLSVTEKAIVSDLDSWKKNISKFDNFFGI